MLRLVLLMTWLSGAADASAWTHGKSLTCGPDTPPAGAIALGYTCEVMWDHFLSTNSIDVNDTGSPSACAPSSDNSYGNIFGSNCNWFVHNGWPGLNRPSNGNPWPSVVTLSSDYSIKSGGGLILAPATDNYPDSMMNTCVYSASAPGYKGFGITGGYYLDVDLTATGSADATAWAAAWSIPWEFFITLGTGSLSFTEVDYFEAPFGRNLHYFTLVGGSTTVNSNYGIGSLGATPYGAANVPGSPSSLFERYSADTLQSSVTLTYGPSIAPSTPGGPTGQPTGTYTSFSNQHECVLLTSGATQSMTVSSVKVWQAPQ